MDRAQAAVQDQTAMPNPLATEIHYRDLAALRAAISDEFSTWSDEIEVTQQLIDAFAKLSGDDYWIHTDPIRAKTDSPFGTTIAHGALVQVLASRMNLPFPVTITGYNTMVNYGSNRMRFPSPVPAGSRIHGRSRIKNARGVEAGTLLTLQIDIHVVGRDRPSAINEMLILYM